MRGFPNCMSHCDHSIFTGYNAQICGFPCIHYITQPPTSRVTIEEDVKKTPDPDSDGVFATRLPGT